jgi:hypothetical protein
LFDKYWRSINNEIRSTQIKNALNVDIQKRRWLSRPAKREKPSTYKTVTEDNNGVTVTKYALSVREKVKVTAQVIDWWPDNVWSFEFHFCASYWVLAAMRMRVPTAIICNGCVKYSCTRTRRNSTFHSESFWFLVSGFGYSRSTRRDQGCVLVRKNPGSVKQREFEILVC